MKKQTTNTTTLTKGTYYIFTDSRVKDVFIENFGDRVFYSRRTRGGSYSTWANTLVGGNPDWEISESTLQSIAHDIFGRIIENRAQEAAEEEAQKPKKEQRFGTPGNRPSWTCQDCGAGIGFLGRGFEKIFGKNHTCQ